MLALLLTAALAAASSPPVDAPLPHAPPGDVEDEVIVLPPVSLPGVPLPTDRDEGARTRVRQRLGLRPQVAVVLATDDGVDAGARLGGALLHHWWTVPPRGVVWSGETTLLADGVVGGVRGWQAEVSTVAGPWLGPVGLRAGPLLRGDRTRVPSADRLLDDAMLVGLRAALTVDADPVVLQAHAAPAWSVVGDRAPGPVPGVTELEVGGSLSGRVRWRQVFRLQPGVGARARLTDLGPVVDVFLLLHVSAGPP